MSPCGSPSLRFSGVIAPRYLVSIENEGQHPSLQVFYELVTFFDISVDQFFFPDKVPDKSSVVNLTNF